MKYCDMCKCPITLSEEAQEIRDKKPDCKCECHIEEIDIEGINMEHELRGGLN
jgi:hypothetical protein